MKNKYLLKTIKQEKLLDKFEEYKKMTREEIEDFLNSGDTNEFSWGFAIYLLNNLDKTLKYIEEHKRNVYDTFGEGIVFGEMEGIKEIIKILKGEE